MSDADGRTRRASTAASVRRALLRTDLPWYALTAGVTAVVTYFALALNKAKIGVPWMYQGDSLSTAAHFKTVMEEGWYEHQPALGAPFGQIYNDFPTADNLHMIAAKILGLFTNNWPVAINMYFFIGFILAALSAFWFLRLCRISPAFSAALSVAFAIAPYHFVRNESHLWLASYYCVPLGLGLLILILRGESLWQARPSRYRLVGVLTGRGAFAVVAVALLATSSSYYAIFFLMMLAVAGIAVLIRDTSWRRFFGAAGIGLVTVAVMLINMAPDMIYTAIAGPNPGGFSRSNVETEIYALKLAQLILPWGGHQIDALRNIRQAYDSTYPLASEQPALGFIAALGFSFAFLFLAYLAMSWNRVRDSSSAKYVHTLGYLSGLTFVAFLLSTMGGVSTLISFFTDALRGWNRMSIVIGALGLAIVGVGLQLIMRSVRKRLRPRGIMAGILVGAVSVGMVGVAYVDQTPFDAGVQYESIQQQFAAEQDYFKGIQASLPNEAMVLQLPYMPFPEYASTNGTQSSEELIPYLHTSTVRWSAGGIKGRPHADWPYIVSQESPAQIVTLAAAADMSGILIDTKALDDTNRDLEAGIRSAVGEPVTSADGRWEFFDIQATRAALVASDGEKALESVAERITDPIEPFMQPDFTGTSLSDLTEGSSTASGVVAPAYSLVNPNAATEITLSMNVAASGTTGTVTITYPDGAVQAVSTGPTPVSVAHTFVLQPGTSYVRLQADTSVAGAPVGVQVSQIDAADEVLRAFVAP